MPLDAEALYMRLGRLVESMPNLNDLPWPIPMSVNQWLGQAAILINEVGDKDDYRTFKAGATNAVNPSGNISTPAVADVINIVTAH